jgi:predicted nucleic acid-binding protein
MTSVRKSETGSLVRSRIGAARPRPFGALDPDDALVPGEARSGQAELFVTADKALLKARSVEGIEIVSPRQFWEALRGGKA